MRTHHVVQIEWFHCIRMYISTVQMCDVCNYIIVAFTIHVLLQFCSEVINVAIQTICLLSGKLLFKVDMNDIPKDPIQPKVTEFTLPLLSKMKPNSSDSHLISHHQRTLPTRTKQNSDSTLINYQHGVHKHTTCTRDTLPLQLVQETTLSAPTLNSESMPRLCHQSSQPCKLFKFSQM